MNNLTLRQLRYFEAVANMGHFGRAAEVCSISQPAISVQIKELEEGLGATLFERGPRQARLTPFGKEFALRVREVLRAVDDLGNMARASTDRMSGQLRIGIIPTIAPYLLPRDLEPRPKNRSNEPAHLPHILKRVAACRGEPVEALAEAIDTQRFSAPLPHGVPRAIRRATDHDLDAHPEAAIVWSRGWFSTLTPCNVPSHSTSNEASIPSKSRRSRS